MPQLWITNGLDTEPLEKPCVLVRFSPDAETPAETVFQYLCDGAYEGERVFHIAATDGWVERRLEGSILTLDLVTYPVSIEDVGVDLRLFNQPSQQDPSAVRILRMSFEVAPAEYANASEATYIWYTPDDAPEGTSLERLKQEIADEINYPFVFAPGPAPEKKL